MVLADPVIRPDGWSHREVSANGARFHLVEALPSSAADAPDVPEADPGSLVLLLHGFPQYWWAWRDQLRALADAGHRAVAMDLRGVGGSDKPPRGYDPLTLAADAAGVIRTLGAERATVVGQGFGGVLAWTLAAAEPDLVTAVVVAGAPHPLVLRAALRDRAFRRANPHLFAYQVPLRPERRLVADDGAEVERLLRAWSARPGYPDADTAWHYREAIQRTPTAFCWMETFRWTLRSLPRNDGRRWVRRVTPVLRQPVLLLSGAGDPTMPSALMDASTAHVAGPWRHVTVPDAGHFLSEEAAGEFTAALLAFLAEPTAPSAPTASP